MERPKEKPRVFNFDDPKVRLLVKAQVDGMRGLVQMLLKPVKVRRSLNQNDTYWGYWVTPFADYLREQDEDLRDDGEAKDAAHDMLARRNLGVVRVTDPETGEVVERAKSTRKLSKEEFSLYMDRCALWLARYVGIVVEVPGDPCRGLSPEGARHG